MVADDTDTPADEAVPDTYSIRLTMAPTENVTIDILPDDITTTTPTSLTFTPGDWWIPQVITVDAAEPQPPEPEQPLKVFPIQSHVMGGKVAGPLFIEGYIDPNADRSINTAIMLPNETDEELPTIPESNVDEDTLIDTLIMHNDSSVASDVGVMDMA